MWLDPVEVDISQISLRVIFTTDFNWVCYFNYLIIFKIILELKIKEIKIFLINWFKMNFVII